MFLRFLQLEGQYPSAQNVHHLPRKSNTWNLSLASRVDYFFTTSSRNKKYEKEITFNESLELSTFVVSLISSWITTSSPLYLQHRASLDRPSVLEKKNWSKIEGFSSMSQGDFSLFPFSSRTPLFIDANLPSILFNGVWFVHPTEFYFQVSFTSTCMVYIWTVSRQ